MVVCVCLCVSVSRSVFRDARSRSCLGVRQWSEVHQVPSATPTWHSTLPQVTAHVASNRGPNTCRRHCGRVHPPSSEQKTPNLRTHGGNLVPTELVLCGVPCHVMDASQPTLWQSSKLQDECTNSKSVENTLQREGLCKSKST